MLAGCQGICYWEYGLAQISKKKKNQPQTNKPNKNRKQNCSSLDIVWRIRGHGRRKGLVSLQYYVSGDTTEIVGNALKITDCPHISVFIQTFHVFRWNSIKKKNPIAMGRRKQDTIMSKNKTSSLSFTLRTSTHKPRLGSGRSYTSSTSCYLQFFCIDRWVIKRSFRPSNFKIGLWTSSRAENCSRGTASFY